MGKVRVVRSKSTTIAPRSKTPPRAKSPTAPRSKRATNTALAALDPVADLQNRLAREATRKARGFWTRYLEEVGARATNRFRGVPITKVRSCVRAWWSDHALADHGAAAGKRIAHVLIEQRMVEDKLAGIIVLSTELKDQLRCSDLSAFATLFANGHLCDPSIVDWFAFNALAALVERELGRADVFRTLTKWRDAETAWQRRAACLAFVPLAPRTDVPGVADVICSICASVVWSIDEIDQFAVGYLLRELARGHVTSFEAFFRRHARFMSTECARMAVARLPADSRRALLAHHKRATTIR